MNTNTEYNVVEDWEDMVEDMEEEYMEEYMEREKEVHGKGKKKTFANNVFETDIVIGKNVVEHFNNNGKFLGFIDKDDMPAIVPEKEIVEEDDAVLSKRKTPKYFKSTIAPWARLDRANKTQTSKTQVNTIEFPKLGEKKVEKKVEKEVDSNNLWNVLVVEDEEVEVEVKKEKPKRVKMDLKEQIVREKAHRVLEDKKELQKRLEKTTMCNFGKNCKRKVCHFAHSLEELKPKECLFGRNCKYFGEGKCKFFHPHGEDKKNYLRRTQHKH